MKKRMNFLDVIAIILVIIGALNWGLVGIFGFNLVTFLFGEISLVTRIIYIVVGLAGLWTIFGCCRCCKGSKQSCDS